MTAKGRASGIGPAAARRSSSRGRSAATALPRAKYLTAGSPRNAGRVASGTPRSAGRGPVSLPPVAGVRSPVAGHYVRRELLANGIRLTVVPQQHLHTATISVFVRVGSRYESRRNNGLSHFLEHMLFRGNGRFPSAYALNWAVERLGGTLNAATYVDCTELELSLPPENVEFGIAIMADILREPRFEDIDVEKGIVREEILESVDERGRDADIDNLARRQLFGTHALGHTITGSAKNVERFTHADLARHMHRYYVGRNMAVVVSGSVNVLRVAAVVRTQFESLRSGKPARALKPPRLRRGPAVRLVDAGGSQTTIRLSFPTFGESDRRVQALRMLARVLDDGMSTRLHQHICDHRGLAYSVFASLDLYRDVGVLDVGTTVEHSKAPEVIAEILAVLYDLVHTPVSQPELDKACARYRWDIRASLDSAEAMAHHYGTLALYERDGALRRLAHRASDVTRLSVQRVAAEILRPERLFVTCTGALEPALRTRIRRLVRSNG